MRLSRKAMLSIFGIGAGLTAVAIGCGKKPASNAELIAISAGIEYVGKDSNFNLAGTPVSSYKMDVTGCESGYSALNQNASPIYLYKFDLSCVATLKEFVFGGITYTGTLSGPMGSTAVFSDGGTNSFKVSVVDQLSSPLVSSDKITFNFFEIKQGGDSLPPGSSYSEGYSVEVAGVEAPNMEIKTVNLNSQAAGGIPTYGVNFECQSNVTAANECPSASGALHAVSAMDVKVVEDTYSGAPTYAQAETLFATAGATPTPIAVGRRTPSIPKGGMSVAAVGPGPLYLKRNLIVFVRYTVAGASSYRYFNLDIGAPAP